jgi:hypothetical protein
LHAPTGARQVTDSQKWFFVIFAAMAICSFRLCEQAIGARTEKIMRSFEAILWCPLVLPLAEWRGRIVAKA